MPFLALDQHGIIVGRERTLARPQLKPPILPTMPDAADMPDSLAWPLVQIKSGQGLFHGLASISSSSL
jgi:hypothetical protein